MQDRSKTVVLLACATQALVVAITIAWVAASGSGAGDSAAAQTDAPALSAERGCDGDDEGAEDAGAEELDCDDAEAAGGDGGGAGFGGVTLY